MVPLQNFSLDARKEKDERRQSPNQQLEKIAGTSGIDVRLRVATRRQKAQRNQKDTGGTTDFFHVNTRSLVKRWNIGHNWAADAKRKLWR